MGQYLSYVKYCSIQSWPCGGLSTMLMVPTTSNLTAPPTPTFHTGFVYMEDLLRPKLRCIHVSENPVTIGLGKDLLPLQFQTITRTSDDLLDPW